MPVSLRCSLVVALSCAACLVPAAATAAPAPARKPEKEIDKKTVEAFENRDFREGWMGVTPEGGNEFAGEWKGLLAAVPVFRPTTEELRPISGKDVGDADLKDLPAVGVPFGLWLLFRSQITDEGLRHLAGVKNLASLAV